MIVIVISFAVIAAVFLVSSSSFVVVVVAHTAVDIVAVVAVFYLCPHSPALTFSICK